MLFRETFCESSEVSGFPEKRVDLWGGPGNFRASLGNFRGSLGNFRGTSGLLLELLGGVGGNFGKSRKFPEAPSDTPKFKKP